MYIIIRKYHSDSPSEVLEKIQQGFVPLVSNMPGFIDYYVFRSENNEIIVTSMFDTQENGQHSTRLAAGWVAENMAHLYSGPPEIIEGETEVAV